MPLDTDTLLVADSFRVRIDPETGVTDVRGFELHLDRFRESVVDMLEGSPDDDWWDMHFEPFMDTVPEQVDRGGEGFPRIELWGGEQSDERKLRVKTRPLPKIGTRISLRTAPDVHAGLLTPYVKGPNLVRLMGLNAELGAEALLTDEQGNIVEGATTSLLWWQGNRLCTSAHHDRVNSITEALIVAIAHHFEHEVYPAEVTPEELTEHEVWAVNALHGLRVVTEIDGAPVRKPNTRRVARYRDALEDTWQGVLGEEFE